MCGLLWQLGCVEDNLFSRKKTTKCCCLKRTKSLTDIVHPCALPYPSETVFPGLFFQTNNSLVMLDESVPT